MREIPPGYTLQKDGSYSRTPRAVGGLESPERKPDPLQALDRGKPVRQRSKSRVEIRVNMLSLRRRLIGSDSLVAGHKNLRDAIAQTLLGGTIGQRDDDPRIEWEYQQLVSKTEGTLVILTRL